MSSLFAWIRQVIRELRRRRVIRVAMVYLGTGFVILEAADILVPTLQLPSWTLRLVTLLLILGFPLAVGLAWVYNITEEGLVEIDEGSESGATQAAHEGKPFTSNAVIIGLLIVAIGLLIYRPVTSPPQGASSEQVKTGGASTVDTPTAADSALENVDPASVAVLPFTYLAAEDSADYLSLGMTDEILTRLSQIEELSVRGRTSVMQYQDTDKTIPQIGRELKVAYVVEGSILMVGDQLEIQVQLVNASQDEHLWSGNYEGAFRNVLDLQNQVAEDVSDQLPGALGIEDQRQFTGAPQVDPKAYRLYLQARRLRFEETGESLTQATRLLQRSLAIDSSFAPAWALLSFCAIFAPTRGGALPDEVQGIDWDSLPQIAARRALNLDPKSAEAHIAVGLITSPAPEVLTHMKRAVELNPGHVNANREYGLRLMWMGRFDLAEQYLQKAARLDPASPLVVRDLGWNDVWRGNYEQGKRHLRKALALGQRTADTRSLLGFAQFKQDSTEAGLRQIRRAVEIAPRPFTLSHLGWAFGQLGRLDSARAVLSRLQQEFDAPFYEASIYLVLGETDRALARLREKENIPGFLKVYPLFEAFRDEPRYQQLLEQRGLDEETVRETLRKLGVTPV